MTTYRIIRDTKKRVTVEIIRRGKVLGTTTYKKYLCVGGPHDGDYLSSPELQLSIKLKGQEHGSYARYSRASRAKGSEPTVFVWLSS